jgi:hypothetical protein
MIAFFDRDLKSFVSINLNEEEPHEQGKKNVDQQVINDQNTSNYTWLSNIRQPNLDTFEHIEKTNPTLEIVLPPPKFII